MMQVGKMLGEKSPYQGDLTGQDMIQENFQVVYNLAAVHSMCITLLRSPDLFPEAQRNCRFKVHPPMASKACLRELRQSEPASESHRKV